MQIQYQAGTTYVDHAGNRTRSDQAADQTIITLYSEQKEYLVCPVPSAQNPRPQAVNLKLRVNR